MAESNNNNNQRSKGTVKWFNGWKGFGFITPDEEGSEDLFVHQTSIQFEGFRTLFDGQRVEFHVEVGDDGRTRAADVVPLRRPSGVSRGGPRGGFGGGGGGGVECYNCGRFGHLARDCYYRGGGGGGGRGRGYGGFRGGRRGGGGGGRSGGRRGECYNCGEEGHFARDCPTYHN